MDNNPSSQIMQEVYESNVVHKKGLLYSRMANNIPSELEENQESSRKSIVPRSIIKVCTMDPQSRVVNICDKMG